MFNAASQVTKQQRKKVIVTIHDAARLRSTQMFGKQDPYVIVYVKGANQRRRVKTHVNEDGGKNPAWNQTLASLDYIHADKSDRIVFEVWNENSMSDSLIGQAVCNLSELFNPTERSVNLPVLVDGKRSGSSTVRVSAHFSDIKTISQVGASLLQQAVSQPPNSTQASARRPSMVSITSRSVPPPPQLPTSASAPSGSAQWAVGPKSSSEETSPPQAPQTVQTPQQPTTSSSSSTTKATVEIVIPKGVKSGNTITVNLPDGRTIKVTVPQGMKPGNKLTINYDVVPKPNRFKAAVARATGPSVSIGQGVTPGLAPSGSFNNNTGTGIGFRSGYQAKTAATVGMAANRFRNGLSQPSSAPVATVAPVMAVVQPVLSSANYVPQQPSYSNQYARQGSSGSFGQVQQPSYQPQPSYQQQPSYPQQPSYSQQQPSYSQQPSYPGQFQRQGSSGSYGGQVPAYQQQPQVQAQPMGAYPVQASYQQQPQVQAQPMAAYPVSSPGYPTSNQFNRQNSNGYNQPGQVQAQPMAAYSAPQGTMNLASISSDKVQQMRMVIGIGSATEQRVRQLIAANNGNVNGAVASFYDAGGR